MKASLLKASAAIVFLAFGFLFAGSRYFDRPLITSTGQRGTAGGTYSAHTLGTGRVALGFYGNGSLDQSFLKRVDTLRIDTLPITGFDTLLVQDKRKQSISTVSINPCIGAGLTNFCDLSLALPLHLDQLGSSQDFGLGDLLAAVKMCTSPGPGISLFALGFTGALSIPTGNRELGIFPRHHSYFNPYLLANDTATTPYFYTSGGTDFETRVLMTLDFSTLKVRVPIVLHANGGARFASRAATGNTILMNAGIEIRPVRSFALVADIASEMLMYEVTHGFNFDRGMFHLSPAVHITPENGFMMTLGGEISLAGSREFWYDKTFKVKPVYLTTGVEPKWRVFAQIGWTGLVRDRDSDKDGIYDVRDRCVDVPEDIDGFEDEDGCPDPDNDQDGLPDVVDKCPNQAEDKDGFQDEDGCPDLDNDNDRIPDSLDQCPNEKEDYDGYVDQDGCPDFDNDQDGVPDSIDKCPNHAEDIDGFQDDDGCPDVDNDQDGVTDLLDKCPNQPGLLANDGCPSVGGSTNAAGETRKSKEIKRGRVVLRGVSFEPGTANIDPNSYLILDDVVASLNDWAGVTIEIVGHTDATGDEVQNRQISAERAEKVKKYLIIRGIDAGRLTAIGKGGSDPIADNATVGGRIINNRIEIRRTDP